VPKRPRPKKKTGSSRSISEKTRAADDKLREALRNADLKAFDRVLAKAVKS
jgi:hypothetical protein